MYSKKNWSDYRLINRRKRMVIIAVSLFIAGIVVTASVQFAGRLRGVVKIERRELLRLWDSGLFEEVYEMSANALVSRPMDYFLLTMHGFSAYQQGLSQINTLNAAQYFDDCVWSLRKAMLIRNSASDGRLYYVLGKAYNYKGESFADLAVKYLEKARELSFNAADIPQFLGMAYASIGDYRNSVASFTEALGNEGELGPSALLLYSIAGSYLVLDELDIARAYLQRCISISQDSRTTMSARLLFAEVMRKSGDFEEARTQLQAVLNEAGENAEARYQMGELYAIQGETTRARAEWRLALRVDPTHVGARTRLSI
ncbi:MAG: tetratricopeptide repeat protein [Treponema sp.]|nr:tetratricopeptide repeat protein [Treponema sp.]